jgi:hypothetical protein
VLKNGHPTGEQIALTVAYDSLAYLTIAAALMSGGIPGVEYTHAWTHIREYIERAQHLLSRVDPGASVELRTKIRENAAFLQDSLKEHKVKEIS